MKIYEVRDITSDETYYVKGFFSTEEKAKEAISDSDSYTLADECEECVILAVYEWELDAYDKGHKKLLEVTFTKDWEIDSEDDDAKWEKEITYPKLTP